MDPSWNPSTDLQAIDRAYRLGSRRDVNVYRLISTGTLEEIMYSRQLYKQQQSNIAVENAQEPRYFEGKHIVVLELVVLVLVSG
jgi:SNF2 family DNA or RNA helicase